MITEWFLGLGSGLIDWFLSLFPDDFELPDWLTGLSGLVGDVLAGAAGMGAWVPWVPITIVVGATFTLWMIGLVIKVVRWLVGLVPTMGGG